jgi:biopolymer transport protein ExbB/TolQ
MDGENLVYFWRLLFPSDSPSALAVSRLIAALFLLGLLDALVALWRLGRERRRIDEAGRALRGAKERPSPLSFETLVKLLRVPADSVVAQRSARALQLRAARMGGLQQTTSNDLDRYGLLARYIAGILTLVGLLGTVLGLSFALFKIQGALMGVNEVAKLQELTVALGSTLRGMKTAFACTLAGLSTSLLLSLANHLVRRFQTSLAERLDDFTFRGLLPFLERLDPGADQAAKAFAQKLKESAEELDKVREVITAAAAQYGTASQDFTGTVHELRGIVTAFESGVTTLSGNQRDFTQAMVETRDALRAVTAADKASDKKEESRQALLENLLNEHRGALRTFSDVLVDLGLNLGAMFEKQAVTDNAEAQRQLLESHRKAYEEALQRSIQELSKAVAQSEERLGSLFKSQDSALRTVSDMVVDFHHNMGPLFERAVPGNGRPSLPTPGR